MNKQDGMHYAPTGKPQPVVKPGEFIIARVLTRSWPYLRHVQRVD